MYDDATRTLRRRLLSKITIAGPDDCWLWTGRIERNGYGKIRVGKRGSTTAPSHRVAYWLLVENGHRWPKDDPRRALEVDHVCENRLCHNPRHLRLVTGKENKFFRHHERDEKFKEDHYLSDSDLRDMDDMLMRDEAM